MAPYYTFKNAGYDVTIASIKGGQIPVDEGSLQGGFWLHARYGREHGMQLGAVNRTRTDLLQGILRQLMSRSSGRMVRVLLTSCAVGYSASPFDC